MLTLRSGGYLVPLSHFETGTVIRCYSKCIKTLNQVDGESSGPTEEKKGKKNKDGCMLDKCPSYKQVLEQSEVVSSALL